MKSLPKTSGIYTITNLVNGKIYIGLATNLRFRWTQHYHRLRVKTHGNIHLQKAWNKYGENAFIFEVLIECPVEYLCSEEHYWCNLLDVHNRERGYNIQPTDPTGNYSLSEETKKKISEKTKGLIPYNKGKKREPYIVDKITAANKGTKRTTEQRVAMSKAFSLPIIQYDKEGNYIREWESIKQAEEELEVLDISSIITGKGILRKNWHFIKKPKDGDIEMKINVPIRKKVIYDDKKREQLSRAAKMNGQNKPFLMFWPNGKNKRYESAMAAYNEVGTDPSTVSKALRGKIKTVKGYSFKYI